MCRRRLPCTSSCDDAHSGAALGADVRLLHGGRRRGSLLRAHHQASTAGLACKGEAIGKDWVGGSPVTCGHGGAPIRSKPATRADMGLSERTGGPDGAGPTKPTGQQRALEGQGGSHDC